MTSLIYPHRGDPPDGRLPAGFVPAVWTPRVAAWLSLLALSLFCRAGAPAPATDTQALVEAAFRTGPVESFLVQQHGELVIEEYRGGMHAGRTTNIKSASKSILSLLVGIAIEEGYLEGVDQTLGEFFPDYFAAHPDPVKQAVTIENLLTMQSGLGSTSRGNAYGAWVLSGNWVEHALDLPMETGPGERMVYSTGNSHLLSVILTRATGMSTRAFAERYLFGPLDITVGGWDRDPQGYYMGGNNLAISPRALLRIGTLVRDGGEYRGRRLVPRDWIERSLRVYTRSRRNPYDYGYLWWQRRLGAYRVRFAWGNGGQFILLLPALDTVVVVTSGAADLDRSSRPSRQRLFRYVRDDLIPWLERRRGSHDSTAARATGSGVRD